MNGGFMILGDIDEGWWDRRYGHLSEWADWDTPLLD
jgi:hypothetical protein